MSYVKSVSGSDYRFLVRGVMLYHTCPWLNLLNGPLMFKRRYVTLLPLFVLLAACSSKPKPTETDTTTGTPSGGFLLEPQHNVMQMGGDFANNPNAQQFIDKMVNKHGFDRQQLQEILSQAKRLDSVLRLMDNQVRYSTVDISLQEVRVLTPTATTFGEKFVEAVTSGWRGFVDGAEDLILVVVYLWPVVLIVLAILLVARPALKRRKARRAEKKQAKLAAKAAAVQAQPTEPTKPDDTAK